MERRLRRDDLLKLAATGAVGLIASRSGLAEAARAQLAKESGRLQVLDWVGYEVKPLWAKYLQKYPGQKPKFTFMTNEANALAKMSAGLKPDDQSDAQLKQSQNLLKSKKKLVRIFWSSETDMQSAFASGDIWIAYAWPADWVAMRGKHLKVAYMYPKEGALSWVGMLMLGKGTSRPEHAHAFANAWSSAQSGSWLENNYGYGHSNTHAHPASQD